MTIEIRYDGRFPNLCSGHLCVTVDEVEWDFGTHVLTSGGGVWFDEYWEDHVDEGAWEVSQWPEGFPDNRKEAVEEAINEQIPWGCCGGCV